MGLAMRMMVVVWDRWVVGYLYPPVNALEH